MLRDTRECKEKRKLPIGTSNLHKIDLKALSELRKCPRCDDKCIQANDERKEVEGNCFMIIIAR